VPLARAICDQPAADDSCLRQVFPKQAQFDFGLKVARQMGYDTARGRLDLTHHPFCTTFALGDVRITTRGTNAILVTRYSRRCTRPATRCMSRA
jgi:carboxypeptidase Taq